MLGVYHEGARTVRVPSGWSMRRHRFINRADTGLYAIPEKKYALYEPEDVSRALLTDDSRIFTILLIHARNPHPCTHSSTSFSCHNVHSQKTNQNIYRREQRWWCVITNYHKNLYSPLRRNNFQISRI